MKMILPDGRSVGWSAIAAEARRQAGRLPGSGAIVNLCEDRLAFLVVLLATALSGRASILPSDRSPEGLRSVAARYAGAAALSDDADMADRAAATGLQACKVQLRPDDVVDGEGLHPAILDAADIVMFTSGSTGTPEPCARKLSFFRQGAIANAKCMFEGFEVAAGIVATVPPYHMFGFELSIAAPLFAGATLYSGRPFYPADVAAALKAVPRPRILVSTPVHLRVLKESGLPMPPVERVFSATAPLSASLAANMESLFGADLREIFGTTETGSIGWRHTAREEAFQLMPGAELTQEGDDSLVAAPHISPPFRLADRLERAGDRTFRIAGRSNDIVNIAGKRMSLAGMNAILAGLDGVVDGAFSAPGDDAEGPVKRMSAIVVAPGLSAGDIRRALRERLDSAFIPRRVALVDALPRNLAGKLPLDEFRRFAKEVLAGLDRAERAVCFSTDEPWVRDHFPGWPIVPGAVLLGEASDLFTEWLGVGAGPVELVSARFPESAVPGEECVFRIGPGTGGQYRIECSQAGRIVMKASMRAADQPDE